MADPLAPDDLDGPPSLPDYEPPADLNKIPFENNLDDEPEAEAHEQSEEDDLVPKVDPVLRVFIDKRGKDASYVQETLKYFGKIEFYGLLGRAMTVLMESDGFGLDEVFDMASPKTMIDKLVASMPGADSIPGEEEDDEAINADQAAKMLSAFAKVVSIAPDLLMEAYCIILQVPKLHRKWMMDWGLPNMEDDAGWDIMHTFVDQNWGVMEDFFGQELPKFFRRAAKARARHKSSGDQ